MFNYLTLAIYLQDKDDPTGGFTCIGAIVIILIALAVSNNRKNKEIALARAAYQDSLTRLKSNPTNADLRQRTLELGRIYSHLTRKKRGVTLFDEVALMNDINAACAGATFVYQTSRAAATSSIEERLAKLSELRAKGLIDEQEYNSRRQKILDEV